MTLTTRRAAVRLIVVVMARARAFCAHATSTGQDRAAIHARPTTTGPPVFIALPRPTAAEMGSAIPPAAVFAIQDIQARPVRPVRPATMARPARTVILLQPAVDTALAAALVAAHAAHSMRAPTARNVRLDTMATLSATHALRLASAIITAFAMPLDIVCAIRALEITPSLAPTVMNAYRRITTARIVSTALRRTATT